MSCRLFFPIPLLLEIRQGFRRIFSSPLFRIANTFSQSAHTSQFSQWLQERILALSSLFSRFLRNSSTCVTPIYITMKPNGSPDTHALISKPQLRQHYHHNKRILSLSEAQNFPQLRPSQASILMSALRSIYLLNLLEAAVLT